MRHLFVTDDHAVKAAMYGFQEPCLAELISTESNSTVVLFAFKMKTQAQAAILPSKSDYELPTHQQLKDWFRNEYDMVVEVSGVGEEGKQMRYYGDIKFATRTKEAIDKGIPQEWQHVMLDGMKEDYYVVLNDVFDLAFSLIK